MFARALISIVVNACGFHLRALLVLAVVTYCPPNSRENSLEQIELLSLTTNRIFLLVGKLYLEKEKRTFINSL